MSPTKMFSYHHAVSVALLAGVCLSSPANAEAAKPAPAPATTTPTPAPAAPAVVAAQPLSANDVSWLFPPPRTARDLAKTIAIGDLKDATKHDPIWPASAFAQFIANAESPAAAIPPNHRIKLQKEAHDISAWRVAGLRIDPGAPGLTPGVLAQFGQQPQLRFILQPVTQLKNGKVKVHDVAAHVIYNFLSGADEPAQPGCSRRSKPDIEAFRGVARDFATLRDDLAKGRFGGVKISTSGALLGVHPGLANGASAKALRDALAQVLERHLSGARLSAMAVMGLADNGPEPWIFMAMAPVPAGVVPSLPNGGFIPLHGPTLDGAQFAQGLAVLEKPHEVLPTPATNNEKPITCKHAALPGAPLPVAERKGVSTAELFDLGDNKLTDPAKIARLKTVVDTIADPARSHFFNTDCVSCHTDTRRALDLVPGTKIPGVNPAVLPKEKWNVRNFGWFPSFFRNTLEATATRRSASETEAVVNFINKNGLANH